MNFLIRSRPSLVDHGSGEPGRCQIIPHHLQFYLKGLLRSDTNSEVGNRNSSLLRKQYLPYSLTESSIALMFSSVVISTIAPLVKITPPSLPQYSMRSLQ